MLDFRLFQTLTDSFKRSPRRRPHHRARAVEALECRLLLTSLVVDTPLDVVDAGDGVLSLREAIAAANDATDHDDISFDASLSGQTLTLAGTELAITQSVTITGPGSGSLTIDADGLSRIFNAAGDDIGNIDVTLRGLTLTGGFAAIEGGGAIISTANLRLIDVVVTNSAAGNANFFTTSAGGLLQMSSGPTSPTSVRTLEITNSAFTNNSARGRGGAMMLSGEVDATITNSVISNNTARAEGGAIHTAFGEGDIDRRNLTLDIIDSTLDRNMSTLANGRGGAIYNAGSTVTILNSTVSNNFARTFGGAFFNAQVDTVFTVTSPQTNVINSTVSGNSTNGSGGVGGVHLLVNSTVVLNRADADGDGSGDGGGLSLSAIVELEAHNSIIAGNVVGSGAGTPSDVSGNLSNGTFNLIGDAATAGGLIDGMDGNIVGNNGVGTIDLASVLETTLAFNGGPTRTHALVEGSPAVDAGSNNAAVDEEGQPLTTDQRGTGFPRIVGPVVDIGAFELSDVPPPGNPGRTDIIARASKGTILVGESDGTKFTTLDAGAIPHNVNHAARWDELTYADFTGDGLTDIASFFVTADSLSLAVHAMQPDGTLADRQVIGTFGSNYENSPFEYGDLVVGDFNADGAADAGLRETEFGYWRVILGSGPGGGNFLKRWSTNVTWQNELAADVNGDGRDDIIGRASNGSWVGAVSDGTQFINQSMGAWSTNVTWSDVQVGDFNNDGMDDVFGRASTGTLVVGISDGARFHFQAAGALSHDNFAEVKLGDFNDDGRSDIFSRSTGNAVVAGLFDGARFNRSVFARLSTTAGFEDFRIADFDADGRDDFAARSAGNAWVVGLSDWTAFETSVFARWSTNVTFDNAGTGEFIMS